MNLKATAHGRMNGFMQTLNGHFDANLADGALEGVDLGYEVALRKPWSSTRRADAQHSRAHEVRCREDVGGDHQRGGEGAGPDDFVAVMRVRARAARTS